MDWSLRASRRDEVVIIILDLSGIVVLVLVLLLFVVFVALFVFFLLFVFVLLLLAVVVPVTIIVIIVFVVVLFLFLFVLYLVVILAFLIGQSTGRPCGREIGHIQFHDRRRLWWGHYKSRGAAPGRDYVAKKDVDSGQGAGRGNRRGHHWRVSSMVV
jgi:energy-coupling factor transporter transmembrane protein EcfT